MNRRNMKGAVTANNLYPLRTIVDTYLSDIGQMMEKLECGHVIPQKSDFYGLTNAYRRRCRKCGRISSEG